MNVPLTRAAEGYPRRSFTVAEIVSMVEIGIIGEEENFELIEGEIVPMSPKGNHHEVVKSALLRIVATLAPDDLRLGVETSLYLSDRTFVEPDLCLYPKRLLPVDVKGMDVLLAIEVAASSLQYDRNLKAKLYSKHGVQELWVIDAVNRLTWVHQAPDARGGWGRIEEREPDAELVPEFVPGLSIVLAGLD